MLLFFNTILKHLKPKKETKKQNFHIIKSKLIIESGFF